MADFSSSGIADLPLVTSETLERGDPRVLGWLKEAVQEGDLINQDDPSYDRFDAALGYVAGRQRPIAGNVWPKYLGAPVIINESRKALQAHVSALTDLKPTFAFRSTNPAYQFHSGIINQLIVAWWVTSMADLSLGDAIKYSLVGGTGDVVVEWDPFAPFGGDNTISARDPRDTLPIRPGQQRDIQKWQGLILREEHPVNVLRAMFPHKSGIFTPSGDTLLSTIKGRFSQMFSKLASPMTDTLSGLTGGTHTRHPRMGGQVLYRTYLTDRTQNLTDKPITMGDPNANWSYVVPPRGYLYPNKRLIVSTEQGILFDGPSTYWHGLYPVGRLKLWDLPWHFMGISLLNDVLPIQDAINDTANDLRLHLKKHTNPQVLYNKQAVSETFMHMHDPRKPGAKIKLNPAAGDGYKELLPPPLPPWALEFFRGLRETYHDMTGTANLQALLQLRQMPSGDTIEKYHNALTPEIRSEARQIEAFLRPVAGMLMSNIFQFMSDAKRVTILGDAGLTLEDFDYDPDTLVPALAPTMQNEQGVIVPTPGYTPELDASKSRSERARYFSKQFVFVVAPNSITALQAQETKMMRLQLARMGYMDFWSMMEALEVPNVGQPPAIPLPPLKPLDPDTLQTVMQGMMAQDPAVMSKYSVDPATGNILEIRVPQTITERLMAQNIMGIGMTQNPAGRKSSGEASPQVESKDGGSRTTVTESDK